MHFLSFSHYCTSRVLAAPPLSASQQSEFCRRSERLARQLNTTVPQSFYASLRVDPVAEKMGKEYEAVFLLLLLFSSSLHLFLFRFLPPWIHIISPFTRLSVFSSFFPHLSDLSVFIQYLLFTITTLSFRRGKAIHGHKSSHNRRFLTHGRQHHGEMNITLHH